MAKDSGKQGSGCGLITGALTFVVVLATIGLTFIGVHFYTWTQRPVLWQGESAIVNIEKGATWSNVLSELRSVGLVKYPLYFDVWARSRDLPPSVRAGQLSLDGPMTLEDLELALKQGGVAAEIEITVPEGFSIFHVADRVERVGLVSRDAFLDAARDEDALRDAAINADSFEGFLFPDTYRFRKGTSAASIVARMHDRFLDVWGELSTDHLEPRIKLETTYGFDTLAFVTLASIVEKESGVHSERALIARVFYNRLDRNMKLQTDPTCVYGPTAYREVPTPKRCKDPLNRYSTYVIEGLPPGPIANPGRAALEAVLTPESEPEAMKLLYFVAMRDGSGGHHFSRTYAEHRQAIKKYLK